MPSRIHWADLRIGMIAICGIGAAMFSILVFARVGALHGHTDKLYVTAPDATGVLSGTEVWLSGQKVGLVKAVRFRPIGTDTLQRLAIEAQILGDRMHLIRKDSYADIRPGGNLIGSPIVYLSSGTAGARAVRNGDTLASRLTGPIEAVGTQLDTVVSRISVLADSSVKVMDLLGSPSTTVGAFRTRGAGQISSASAIASSMKERALHGSGTLGLAHQNAVGVRIRRVMAEKDSIILLVSSGRGNVGRFRKDSTLLRSVASVRAGVDSIRALFSTAGNGVTRLRSDTALKAAITQSRAQLDSLMRDIKKHPLRYISF